VVVEHDRAREFREITLRGPDQSRDRGVAGGQIVEPRSVNEFASDPTQIARLHVVRHQIEGEHVFGRRRRDSLRRELFRHERRRIGSIRESQQGLEVLLRVELEPVGPQLALEVDGQVRDPQHGAPEVDPYGARRVTVSQRHAPGQ
jgi:hypothetical protein